MKLSDCLRRARELCLERAHQLCGLTDWWALVLDAAGGDREVAADALELLDAVAPGEEAATLRLGAERMKHFQRLAEGRGILPPEDPALRFYDAGLAFDFWAQGGVFLADDSPEAKAAGSSVSRTRSRSTAELAAVLGKACVLAELRPAPTGLRRWPTAAPAPISPPAPVNPFRAGYVQEPEEND